jgi:transposase
MKKASQIKKKPVAGYDSLKLVNPNAAAIDVGSRTHWVAVGQNLDSDVKTFGVFTKDHNAMIEFFKERNIVHVAMECTGSYWQTLYASLDEAGFNVQLTTSKTIKNPEGKTDHKDCRWLQKLHSFGLLKSAFLPEIEIGKLRQYCRLRANMAKDANRTTNRMQKVMQLMNIRLEVVLSDITGKSGMNIIKAIVDGERNAINLSLLVASNVKKSSEEIASALLGNWKEELLYELIYLFKKYNSFQDDIIEVDKEIEKQLQKMAGPKENTIKIIGKKKQKGNPKFDVTSLSFQYYGVNLTQIDSIGDSTIMTLLSEVGKDITKFPTAKAFTNWLRLAPQHKITGGKIIGSRSPKGKNTLAVAFRNAANTIGQRKEGSFKAFFNRLAYKGGRGAAITGTARKLAAVVWTMIHKQEEFIPMNETVYNEKVKHNVINNMKKKMQKLGISLNELSIVSNNPNLNFATE